MWDAWPTARTLIVSHRGLAPGHRENTIEAAQAAFLAGADAIEVDVRCTADGVPILHHDRQLDGLTVASTPHRKLRERARQEGYELASVDAVLDAAAGQGAVNLEIKDPAATEPVLALLEERKDPPVLVSGFDRRVLETVRRLAPALPAGIVLGRNRAYRMLFSRRRARRLAAWLGELEPDVLILHRAFLRWRLARHVVALGIPVAVWTVNGTRRLRDAIVHPLVWAVITDQPPRAHHARSLVEGRGIGDRPPGEELMMSRTVRRNQDSA